MAFIGLSEETKGYIFMRSPNNIIFTAIQALFDKTLFPKCPNMHCLGYTSVGLPPDDLQGEHNRPLDDKNEDYGGGSPPISHQPAAPQLPAWYLPRPPRLPAPSFGHSDQDDDDMYMSRSMTPPQVSWEPTSPVNGNYDGVFYPLGWEQQPSGTPSYYGRWHPPEQTLASRTPGFLELFQ